MRMERASTSQGAQMWGQTSAEATNRTKYESVSLYVNLFLISHFNLNHRHFQQIYHFSHQDFHIPWPKHHMSEMTGESLLPGRIFMYSFNIHLTYNCFQQYLKSSIIAMIPSVA